ncbi:hypothetical protein B5807_06312 [Epicoccum nigrum]|uniref:HIG1 domain-containing protein n=1 Tax=Epicoccum nigrum TaxID=105696 RepID=A0A1Y2LVX0_EPING|nr:hypothetical protein G6514_005250 [Epicoccum nigrum]OSS47739.1 hypothetical protein B5807_06312 [Epicoccum nigrum]
MKVLTPEQEQAHYDASVKGGVIGGVIGTAIGTAAVIGASKRYPSFKALTLPFRAFLVTSTGTFIAVIAADRASAKYDIEHNPEKKKELERERERAALLEQNKTVSERAKEWATENRYPLLFGFWVASMAGSWVMVNRNPYLSGSQKLVQARMYAQGGTLAALLASFALEGADAAKGKGRWETVKVVDPNDPEHKHLIEKRIHHERYQGEDQWREMIEAEEARMKERNAHIEAKRQHPENKGKQEEAKKEKKDDKDKSGATH